MRRYFLCALLLLSAWTYGTDPSYALLELRIYAGFRDQGPLPGFHVRALELDPQAAMIREKEERSIQDIFQLSRVRYLSSLRLWLPELRRQSQTYPVTVHDRQLNIQFEPLDGPRDRFRLLVSLPPAGDLRGANLLDTVVILPQRKRAVLGFRDDRQQIHFISLGREDNVKLGIDDMVDGKAVRFPRLLKTVAPDYPFDALTQGVEGMVVVDGTTDALGRTRSVEVLYGPGVLSAAVRQAVSEWIYRPFNVDGVDEPTRFVVACFFFIRPSAREGFSREKIHGRFDEFWDKHEKSNWPDPLIEEAVSRGINRRLVEFVIIEGTKDIQAG